MENNATGWLVHAGKYSDRSLTYDMVRRQKESLENIGVPFDFIDVFEASSRLIDIMGGMRPAPAWVLFRNSDMEMRHALEMLGTRCVNSYETASICRDKFLTAAFCSENDIPHPKTLKVPALRNISWNKENILDAAENKIGYPMVVKDDTGEEGRGVVLARNRLELAEAIPDASPSCIIQDFIDSSWGRDARIFVVGDKIPLSVERANGSGDFRSNTSQGGSMEVHALTEEERALAEKVGKLLPYSSISVDIMWKNDGSPIVCELNGNPNFGTHKKHIFHTAPIAPAIAEMIAEIYETAKNR